MRTFAISDIHGCTLTFKALIEKIQLTPEDKLYLLGDYIDRGPDSKGVIDYIWQLQEEGHQVFCLWGNHEQMMLESQSSLDMHRSWWKHGGKETLQSFGVETTRAVPKKYLEWFNTLPYYFEVNQYILVHAGFRFEMTDPFMERDAMLWQRSWYNRINRDWLGDRIIVHGHTPTVTSEIERSLTQLNRLPAIVIDNGCVYQKEGMGQLVALELENQRLHFQPRLDVGI